MNTPALSIIISVFNKKECIERCLDSLRKQIFQNFEIILINDHSTDGTEVLIKNYCENHPNFLYVDGKNKGSNACRNQGLALAKGKYIGFIEPEDWTKPSMFQSMISLCEEFKADSVICSTQQFDEKTGQFKCYFDSQEWPSLIKINPVVLSQINAEINNRIYLRKNIETMGLIFSEIETGAEVAFIWRYYLTYPRTAVVKKNMYIHTLRDESLERNKPTVRELLQFYSTLIDILQATQKVKEYKVILFTMIFFDLKKQWRKEKKHCILLIKSMIQFFGLNFFLDLSISLFKKKISLLIIDSNYTAWLNQYYQYNLVKYLIKYSVYDNKEALKLIRLGSQHDGGYVVPEKAVSSADLLMSYGISTDIAFEEAFSSLYNKTSYGFDCGVEKIESNNKRFTFVSECIASDDFLIANQTSSKNISSFSQQLIKFKCINKKIFIKMDIEGAEYEAFQGILPYSSNITGIAIEIHLVENKHMKQACQLLKKLNKKFILMHVHGNNFAKTWFTSKNAIGQIPRALELTYINKNLSTEHCVSKDQYCPSSLDAANNKFKKDVEFQILLPKPLINVPTIFLDKFKRAKTRITS